MQAIGRKIDISNRRTYLESENPNAKLSENQILMVQELRKKGETIYEIAKKFGVHRTTITRICKRKEVYYKPSKWSEKMKESQKIARKIHSTKFIRNVSGAKNPRAILDENKVLSIRQLISDGHKPIEIAASYGISYGTVMAIKFNKIWKHI